MGGESLVTSEAPTAYELAEYIHSSFLQAGVLTRAELESSGVGARLSYLRGVPQIVASNEIVGARVRQTLSRDRTGTFQLTTAIGGSEAQICIDPRASFAATEALLGSLFMGALVKIAYLRDTAEQAEVASD